MLISIIRCIRKQHELETRMRMTIQWLRYTDTTLQKSVILAFVNWTVFLDIITIQQKSLDIYVFCAVGLHILYNLWSILASVWVGLLCRRRPIRENGWFSAQNRIFQKFRSQTLNFFFQKCTLNVLGMERFCQARQFCSTFFNVHFIRLLKAPVEEKFSIESPIPTFYWWFVNISPVSRTSCELFAVFYPQFTRYFRD